MHRRLQRRTERGTEPDCGPARAAPVPVQRAAAPLPRHDIAGVPLADVAQRRAPNRSGLPDTLRAGIETLSGLSMDGVRVHYGSPEPARLGALAYTRGRDIHLAPGQEKHLPHEAWHAVQQADGGVAATTSAADVPINDDQRLEREADAMGAKAVLAGAAAAASPAARAPRPTGTAPAVAQRFLDVADMRATAGNKAALLSALQKEAATLNIAWKPEFETLLDTELATDKTRGYADVATLLNDLVAVDGGGDWTMAQKAPRRSETKARALRQSVKFHRTHTRNPSQPNPIATGFHNYPPDSLLKPPPGVQIVQDQGQYHFFREDTKGNTTKLQISTTGDPENPGYIYTDDGQFAGNYDSFDTTGKWSVQGRKESEREYMDLGQHKFQNHTVGHVMPFEHSPFVHDTAETVGSETTYKNTDQFEHNVVIENPVVGEQIKRDQVEAKMMDEQGWFYQYPVYSGTSPVVPATYNGAEFSKKRKRPDELQFGRPDGSGGTEWAAFDNTGGERYDTDEKKLKKTGKFDKRTDKDWWKRKKKKNEKRVRPGMKIEEAWDVAKKQNPVTPPLAKIVTLSDDITTYDPWIDTLKADVSGYDSPPPTPYYMGPSDPAVIKQVKGHVTPGEKVTTLDGHEGLVIYVTNYDHKTDESTIEFEPVLDPYV